MKILHIGQMIGGLDVYIRNSIVYADDSFEYVIVRGDEDEHKPVIKNGQAIRECSIKMRRRLNPLNDSLAVIQAINIIRKEKPDVIHCHSAKGGFIGRWAGFFTRVKTLYTPHAFSFLSTESKLKRNIFLWLEKIARLDSYLLACSESEQQLGIETVGYRQGKALVWHNAVPDAARQIMINKGSDCMSPYICFIGRPSYQKNTFFLLDVVKKVRIKHPEVKFYLVGVGYYSPDLEKLKQKIVEYNLEQSFAMLPWLSHEDTLRYVSDALLYLTVSRYEGLPLAVIEAMSLGKVVVASDVYGNNDCVKNGENGFLLPLEVNAFTDKLCQIIENKKMRDKMGLVSRTLFEENFLIDRRIIELENIYKDVAQK